MSEKPIIELVDIKKHYASGQATVKALDGVSLSIYEGEMVAIMGHSGSGKSTLMNLIGCLDRASSGSYRILGEDVQSLDSDELAKLRRETFGFIFQRYNLLANATSAENVEVPALYAGVPHAKRRERALKLLSDLGLHQRDDHYPSQLSGGQQQRVAIARSLMNNPPVILADEPTGALDSKNGQDVMALLKQLNQSEGRTVIVITHEEDIAAQARRIIRISDGKIVEDSGRDMQAQPKGADTFKTKSDGGNWGANSVEAVKTAFRALKSNIFRTSLTLLGIIIGVAAVIVMLAIGNGSKQKVLESITSMGTNLIDVRPGAMGVRGAGDVATLIIDDAKAILEIDNIEAVVPERGSQKSVRYSNVDYRTSIRGTGESFPDVRNWTLQHGSFFSIEDVKSYSAVAVLGSTVADMLFSDTNPLGKFILIGNVPFEVIGVTASKGAAPWGGDQDDVIYVPYTTGMARLFGYNYLSNITIKVSDTKHITTTQKKIEELLLERHGTEDFHVRNMASFLQMATDTQNTLTILLGAVAAISLLVGGIGVMNIMLVSVVERTREIGVRIATGARMNDIMVQFNTEAAVVCTIGGILGVLIGFGAGYGISLFGVKVAFSPAPAIIAFTCAVITGILFGYLPARKAAKLDPVTALSTE